MALCAAGTLAVERAEAAITDLNALRVQRVPHDPLLARCWDLRENVTIYDAVYIALSETFDAAPAERCNHPGNSIRTLTFPP
jgi:predicted nucleic acid-binding protein